MLETQGVTDSFCVSLHLFICKALPLVGEGDSMSYSAILILAGVMIRLSIILSFKALSKVEAGTRSALFDERLENCL